MKKRMLWRNAITRRVAVELIFEPRDMWIGVFISDKTNRMGEHWRALYICVLPCLPIRVAWYRGLR